MEFEVYLVVRKKYVPCLSIELPKNFYFVQIADWYPDPLIDLVIFSYIAKRMSADVVHFTGNTGCILLCAKTQVVLTIHDVSFLKDTDIVPFPRNNLKQAVGRFYRKAFVPLYAKLASEICTVSDFAVKDIKYEMGIDADFIYHGKETFNNTAIAKKNFKKNEFSEPDHSEYLIISGVDPQKNLYFVVSAFIKLYYKYKKFAPKLNVIGVTWNDYEKLHSDTFLTENIMFLGMCSNSEVQAHIFRSKTIIIPSFYESFGLPVVESLSCLKAPLCSSEGALPEVGGTFAHYFNPRDQASLVNLIEAIETGNLQINLPAQQVEQYLERFSWFNVSFFYKKKYGVKDEN